MSAPQLGDGVGRRRSGDEQLAAGRELLVRYNLGGPGEFHAQFLLAVVWGGSWMVLTPDADIYEEGYSDRNPGILIWRLRPRGRGMPHGVHGCDVYDFAELPSAMDQQPLQAEGEARRWR